MKKTIVYLLCLYVIISCENSTESTSLNDVEVWDDLQSEGEEGEGIEVVSVVRQNDNFFEYKGHIDGKYDIKMHLYVSTYIDNDVKDVSGYYWYVSNDSYFQLKGKFGGNELELNRYGNNGELKEVFRITTDSLNHNLNGTWKLKDNEPVQLNLNYSSTNNRWTNSFLYEVKNILANNDAVVYANIADVQEIKAENDQMYIESNDVLYCHYSGNRIFVSGTSNSSSASTDEEMSFLLMHGEEELPGAAETMSFAKLSVFNIYDFSNVTEDSDEDDDTELTNFWELIIFNSSAGELWESQTISGEGDGVLNYIFTQDELILMDNNGKDSYFYDKSELKYVKSQ